MQLQRPGQRTRRWRTFIKDGELYGFCYPHRCFELPNRPEQIQCLMGYLVNLILILQVVDERRVRPDNVYEIIYEFVLSGRKESIHNEIATLFGDSPASYYPMDEVKSLIEKNVVKFASPRQLITKNISQIKNSENDKLFSYGRTKPPLPSLLAILRVEVWISDAPATVCH